MHALGGHPPSRVSGTCHSSRSNSAASCRPPAIRQAAPLWTCTARGCGVVLVWGCSLGACPRGGDGGERDLGVQLGSRYGQGLRWEARAERRVLLRAQGSGQSLAEGTRGSLQGRGTAPTTQSPSSDSRLSGAHSSWPQEGDALAPSCPYYTSCRASCSPYISPPPAGAQLPSPRRPAATRDAPRTLPRPCLPPAYLHGMAQLKQASDDLASSLQKAEAALNQISRKLEDEFAARFDGAGVGGAGRGAGMPGGAAGAAPPAAWGPVLGKRGCKCSWGPG